MVDRKFIKGFVKIITYTLTVVFVIEMLDSLIPLKVC